MIKVTIDRGDELNCWIYTNLKDWRDSPQSARFFLVDEDEVDDLAEDEKYRTIAGEYLPIALRALDLHPWFESGTLVGVVENALIPREPSQAEVERFILAANHYREYDDFYDHPAPSV